MDIINTIYSTTYAGYEFLSENAYLYQEEFWGIVIGMMLLIALVRTNWKTRRQWRRTMRRLGVIKGIKQMNKGEYREHLKTLMGDAIFNALEDLVEEKKLSRHECTKTLRQISKLLNIPGFISQEKLDLTSLTAEEFETVQSVLRSKKRLKKLILDNQKTRIPVPDPKAELHLAAQRRAEMIAKQEEALQTKKVFGGTLLKRKTAIV